jgi:hypothetical protein
LRKLASPLSGVSTSWALLPPGNSSDPLARLWRLFFTSQLDGGPIDPHTYFALKEEAGTSTLAVWVSPDSSLTTVYPPQLFPNSRNSETIFLIPKKLLVHRLVEQLAALAGAKSFSYDGPEELESILPTLDQYWRVVTVDNGPLAQRLKARGGQQIHANINCIGFHLPAFSQLELAAQQLGVELSDQLFLSGYLEYNGFEGLRQLGLTREEVLKLLSLDHYQRYRLSIYAQIFDELQRNLNPQNSPWGPVYPLGQDPMPQRGLILSAGGHYYPQTPNFLWLGERQIALLGPAATGLYEQLKKAGLEYIGSRHQLTQRGQRWSVEGLDDPQPVFKAIETILGIHLPEKPLLISTLDCAQLLTGRTLK